MKWKKIILNDEETKYEISDTGLYRSSWGRRDGLLKINKDKSGYPLAYLYHKKKRFTLKIHRLVAFAFVDNPNEYDTVNHKDGDKGNNHYSNLEWCTRSMNTKHAYDTGIKMPVKGVDHYLSKSVAKFKDGVLIKAYLCGIDAERDGYCRPLISQSVRLGCRHKGYYWKYIDEPIQKTV